MLAIGPSSVGRPLLIVDTIVMTAKTLRLFSAYLVLSLALHREVSHAIQLKTTSSRLAGVSGGGEKTSNANALQSFISRPENWPKIVLSSNRVEVIKARTTREAFKPFLFLSNQNAGRATSDVSLNDDNASSETLKVGDTVVEFFALNQFQVEWTCTINEPGRLVVVSPDGVPGIATDCVMDFEFDAIEDDASVNLTMEYTPKSPLAVLATPALVVDNWLALNALLPAAVDTKPLDSFRKLMGILYGVAGMAHLFDLLVGGSQLFTSVIGIPSFEDLDLAGQVYALIWCATGPVAYYLSTSTTAPSRVLGDAAIALSKADVGLILYGIVEMLGAIFSSGMTGASPDVLSNAGGVQAVVLAAWVYSYRKQEQLELPPRA
mmetsp:Transcript_20406/g.50731  ORF Transcript_20406/g.50731 Transcript_20406/m.50731 type:complete len:378 (+) Transcript_20406:130-1263(+)